MKQNTVCASFNALAWGFSLTKWTMLQFFIHGDTKAYSPSIETPINFSMFG